MYLKSEQYEDILNAELRSSKYPNLKDTTIGVFLEKIKVETGLFAKNADKNKRRAIENVMRVLKISGPSILQE